MIGGVSVRRVAAQNQSTAAPAAEGHRHGDVPLRRTDPGRPADPVEDLAHGAGVASVDDQRLAVRVRAAGVDGGHQRGRRVVDVRRVDQCRPRSEHGQATRPGAGHESGDQLGVARPPHQVGPDGEHGQVGTSRRPGRRRSAAALVRA